MVLYEWYWVSNWLFHRQLATYSKASPRSARAERLISAVTRKVGLEKLSFEYRKVGPLTSYPRVPTIDGKKLLKD